MLPAVNCRQPKQATNSQSGQLAYRAIAHLWATGAAVFCCYVVAHQFIPIYMPKPLAEVDIDWFSCKNIHI